MTDEVLEVMLLPEHREELLLKLTKARTEMPHENLHLCYHEAGHALMNILFYNDLIEVTIVPCLDDANPGYVINGACKRIDCEKLLFQGAMPEAAYRAVQNIIETLAGSIAERLFCRCGWCPDGDRFDREDIPDYYADLENGVTKDISPLVTEFMQRYRHQLDAIANALLERKTLIGAGVREVMLASGWKAEDLTVASFDSYLFCEEVLDAWIPDPELFMQAHPELFIQAGQ